MHRRIMDFPAPDDPTLFERVERLGIFRGLLPEKSSANCSPPAIGGVSFSNTTPEIAPLFPIHLSFLRGLRRRFSTVWPTSPFVDDVVHRRRFNDKQKGRLILRSWKDLYSDKDNRTPPKAYSFYSSLKGRLMYLIFFFYANETRERLINYEYHSSEG